MRRFLSPRWLALHLLAVVAFCGCLALGWWQLTRAEGGNAISWGYTFEWPVFALFSAAFWVKLVRDERRRLRPGGNPEPQRLRTPVLAGAARPPRVRRPVDRSEDRVPESDIQLDRIPDGSTGDEGDDELAAYNRYLAWQNANPELHRRDYPG
ncbi:MAG: hypothetical protein WCA46_12405 [Actinocatenispora sp.]